MRKGLTELALLGIAGLGRGCDSDEQGYKRARLHGAARAGRCPARRGLTGGC